MGLLALRCVHLILLVEHSRLKLPTSVIEQAARLNILAIILHQYALKLLSLSRAEHCS